MLEAVLEYRPDAIISELTALGGPMDLFHFDRYFAQTNMLRTRGNDNLLAAARTFGVGKFVAQRFGGWPYRPVGSCVGQTLLPGQMRSMMSEMRGCDNTKIKNELGWQLRYPSWRQGFREGLG